MTVEEYNNCVDAFSDNLYRFLLKNIKDEALASDFVQDSYEILWLNYKKIDAKKAKSYLFSTGYHTMIDYIRKHKKISHVSDNDLSSHVHFEQYSDLKELLNNAIMRLPEDQKAVVLLRDYEGYSYDEISEITGLSESQVKVYIYRARVFLKNYIVKMENVA
ncbi:MAG: RNA polymerase subunit sigma-24 [Bacteroidetes bacterium 4572_117]|nr:MAG: RNA polymerase subunit sigma-24 [Bacteroidetes bacterium 4572_117]